MNEIEEIIDFFLGFERFKNYNREQIRDHISKSIENSWYRIQRENNDIVSYTDWVYLDKDDSEFFTKHGMILNRFYKGEQGDCFIKDSLYIGVSFWKDIKTWGHNYFFKQKKLKSVSWLGLKDDKVDYVKTIYPKVSDG